MRTTPMPISNPGTGRKMPTPAVTKKVVTQEVDMKPKGNTVAITTTSDNPFERKNVTVVTQASGGAPGVPASMQSRGIMHSFLPGLGDDENGNEKAANEDDGEPWYRDWLSAGENIFTSREGRKTSQAQADIAAAKAREAEAEAEAEIARSRTAALINSTSVDTGMGFKVNLPLILLGGGLLAGAYFLSRKK